MLTGGLRAAYANFRAHRCEAGRSRHAPQSVVRNCSRCVVSPRSDGELRDLRYQLPDEPPPPELPPPPENPPLLELELHELPELELPPPTVNPPIFA